MTLDQLESILSDTDLTVRRWDGDRTSRLYLKHNGRDLGYLVDGDDGTTGTCCGLSRRRGYVAGLIRDAERAADIPRVAGPESAADFSRIEPGSAAEQTAIEELAEHDPNLWGRAMNSDF